MLAVGCVVVALAVLYFWLSGHWFARVVVWIALGAICGVAFAEVTLSELQIGYNPPVTILLIGLGWLIAWPISRIPLYRQRRRVRQNSAVRAMIV